MIFYIDEVDLKDLKKLEKKKGKGRCCIYPFNKKARDEFTELKFYKIEIKVKGEKQ